MQDFGGLDARALKCTLPSSKIFLPITIIEKSWMGE